MENYYGDLDLLNIVNVFKIGTFFRNITKCNCCKKMIDKKKDGYRFAADNTGEVTPFDWYKLEQVLILK